MHRNVAQSCPFICCDCRPLHSFSILAQLDGQHVPLSEKLQKFALDHEAYFNSASAISLLSAMSQSPAVYVDASSTEAAATETTEKVQADNKLSENQCEGTSKQALNGCDC